MSFWWKSVQKHQFKVEHFLDSVVFFSLRHIAFPGVWNLFSNHFFRQFLDSVVLFIFGHIAFPGVMLWQRLWPYYSSHSVSRKYCRGMFIQIQIHFTTSYKKPTNWHVYTFYTCRCISLSISIIIIQFCLKPKMPVLKTVYICIAQSFFSIYSSGSNLSDQIKVLAEISN